MKYLGCVMLFCLLSVQEACAAAAVEVVKAVAAVEVRDMLKFSHQLVGHKALVRAALSVREGKLATGSDDTTVRLWNLKTKQGIHVFTGHIGPVTCLTNLVDDRVIISGSTDGTARMWNIEDGSCVGRITHDDGPAFTVQLRPIDMVAVAMNGNVVLPTKSPASHAEYHPMQHGPSQAVRRGKHTKSGIVYSDNTADSTMPVKDVVTYCHLLNTAEFLAQSNKKRDLIRVLKTLYEIQDNVGRQMRELTLLSDGNVAVRKPEKLGIVQIISGQSGETLQEIGCDPSNDGAFVGLPGGGFAYGSSSGDVEIYLYKQPKKDILLCREDAQEEKEGLLVKRGSAKAGGCAGNCVIS